MYNETLNQSLKRNILPVFVLKGEYEFNENNNINTTNLIMASNYTWTFLIF